MKKHLTYKDSEVAWMGDVPEHWEIKRLKLFSEIILGKMLTPEDKGDYFLKPYLRAKNLNWLVTDMSDVKKMWFSVRELEIYKLKKDDLLVSEGGEVGRTCIWDDEIEDCFIQNSVNRVRLKDNYPRYFLYQFFAAGHKGYFDAIVNRVSIAHLTKEKLADVIFTLPPLSEQQAIANYLDHKTAQLNTVISKKERLIELLHEERTALISHVVTKGLNPDAPMKDSGVAWLGQVPKEWNVIKLKYLATKIGSGVTPKGGASVYQRSGIPFIRSQNVYFDRLRLENIAFISDDIHKSMSGSKVFPRDVLLNITGASIGRCCVVPDKMSEANVNQHVCIIRPNKKVLAHYLNAFISSNAGQLQIFSGEKGISREGLTFEQLKQFDIFLPPHDEQAAIISYLDRETTQIEERINHTEKQTNLLKEYRTALISAAVTGKMDVRKEEI